MLIASVLERAHEDYTRMESKIYVVKYQKLKGRRNNPKQDYPSAPSK
jgi:hypothetical protein